MTNVSEWSTSAGSNNSAPPDGWPEGMLPGKVNDCAREMMSALAKWYRDQSALLITGGSGNSYTLTTNCVYTSLNDVALLVFRTDRANTGAATLNVDTLGAKPLRKNGSLGDYASGELVSGQTVVVTYNSSTDDFEVVGPAIENAPAASASPIPAGTVMLFQQTAAPTGWTKNVTHNNKALRLVSGTASTGGTTAFTSVFTSRTIATANLPSHTHGAGSFAVDTTITNGTLQLRNTVVNNSALAGSGEDVRTDGTSVTVALTDGAVTGTSGATGSDTAMDFDVQYVDIISATKT